RLGREKSIDLVLKSSRKLMEKHPQLKILLVGDGPQKNELKKLAISLGMEKSVIFTGYLQPDTIPLAYKASDYFITASTTETQGLCSVEAAASGLPVIAIEDSAHRDIFGNDGDALFFSNGEELPHELDRLLTLPRLEQSMREKSVKLSHRFTVEEFGNRVNDYYSWIKEEYPRVSFKKTCRK
ncbi:MAG: glycosyltransferase, partial [Spirochaetaceae bacterium]